VQGARVLVSWLVGRSTMPDLGTGELLTRISTREFAWRYHVCGDPVSRIDGFPECRTIRYVYPGPIGRRSKGSGDGEGVLSESEQRVPWYVYPLSPLVLLLMIPAALLSIPFAYLMAGLQSIDEMRFYRRMRERRRFIEWADLTPALRTGSGTLIIEQGHKRPVRVWWTPDEVLSLAPCPPPSPDELRKLALGAGASHEFVAWCHRRYTSEDPGSAMSTLPSSEPPAELFSAPLLKDQFPRISAIDTVYYRGGSETLRA
jgi:hypothetical protein